MLRSPSQYLNKNNNIKYEKNLHGNVFYSRASHSKHCERVKKFNFYSCDRTFKICEVLWIGHSKFENKKSWQTKITKDRLRSKTCSMKMSHGHYGIHSYFSTKAIFCWSCRANVLSFSSSFSYHFQSRRDILSGNDHAYIWLSHSCCRVSQDLRHWRRS